MKIAISAAGETLESNLDPRFGRAAYFLIVDSDSFDFTVMDNTAAAAAAGAGISAAQKVIEQNIQAVITGQLGPNALEVLQAENIDLFQGKPGSVYSNMIAFNQHQLKRISEGGPAHAGIGHHGGRQ